MTLHVQSTVVRHLPAANPAPVDAPELHALAQYVRAGRCALFVGAGLSAGAGLPAWPELMERLVKRITPWAIGDGIVPQTISIVDDEDEVWRDETVVAVRQELGERRFQQLLSRIRRKSGLTSAAQILALALEVVGHEARERAELTRLLQQKRFPELAGFCRDRLGRAGFAEQVRRGLVPKRGLTAAHRHIVRIPFACVVTTNFDTLLEQAYAAHGNAGVPRAPTGVDLTQLGTLLVDGSFFVLKAHGDGLRPETMVFSADDYRRLIHATPAFQAVFSSILMTHALLFVGYSLSDANFRLLLDEQFTVFNGEVPPRYALLSGVGFAEEDILWRTARLQVLSYPEGQHQHVEQFLGALADATSPESARAAEATTSSETAPAAHAATSPGAAVHPDTTAAAALAIQVHDDRLFLDLTRAQRGRARPHTWAVPLGARELDQLAAAARSAVLAHLEGPSATPEIARVGELLKGVLPADLLRRLRALPRDSSLQLTCWPGIHRIPWEFIHVDDEPICLRLALARTPVSILDTARGYPALGRAVRAVIIGDAGSAGDRLPPLAGAEFEAREIASLLRRTLPHEDITHISREAATRARILRELSVGDYDIIHFAGHAWFTERESYFYTWDDVMLGSELTPLLSRRPPALLVMSTHFTSFLPLGFVEDFRATLVGRTMSLRDVAHEPLSGFAEVAMRCGVGAFVGSFGEPPDVDTAESMIAFYQALLDSQSVGSALLAARRERVASGHTSSLMMTATGYGELRIVAESAATGKRRRRQQPRARSRAANSR